VNVHVECAEACKVEGMKYKVRQISFSIIGQNHTHHHNNTQHLRWLVKLGPTIDGLCSYQNYEYKPRVVQNNKTKHAA